MVFLLSQVICTWVCNGNISINSSFISSSSENSQFLSVQIQKHIHVKYPSKVCSRIKIRKHSQNVTATFETMQKLPPIIKTHSNLITEVFAFFSILWILSRLNFLGVSSMSRKKTLGVFFSKFEQKWYFSL